MTDVSPDVDVLVVGSGAAGLCAALAAVEHGAHRVLVAEGSPEVGGSSRLSGGIVMGSRSGVQHANEIYEDEDALFHDYRSLMRWDVTAGPVRKFARRSGETIDWLAAHGVPFFDRLIFGGEERAPRSHAVDGGGQALIDALHRAATARQIDIALGQRVDRLLVEDGRVVGVAVGDDEITAGAVVLATGGFGAAPEKIAELFPSAWDPERTWYIGHDGARGDALDLAGALGAQVTGHDRGLRTLGPGGTFVNEALLPGWVVLLDPNGHRFADETAPYGILDNAVRAHGNRCVAFLDAAALQPPAELADRYRDAYKQVWPNHAPFSPRHYKTEMIEFLLGQKTAFVADDLASLAVEVGLDPTAVVGEIDRYNGFADAGTDADHGKAGKFLLPLRTPPFYAVPLYPITVNLTGAGLRIDDCARVIGADGRPVPGLFAAGECVGGLLGPLYMGSGNSLGLATGVGRIAGEEAAALATGAAH
ncbi:FAD-dependent oxidoreductase [Sporichthya polymorpha]|uniref:FAD-dependent oxidoreductase n=1 Tax=Sporichthya polymorpha TaxID=35751 RepID=UPI00037C44BD|nr:FAD-dependent oxidoreductase [Sporichthya polymorpha]